MARNSKVSMVLVGMVIMITILAGVANAGVTPSVFATQKGCESAVLAGEGAYKFYVPKYFGGAKKNPVDGGATKVVAPLEAIACVHMNTTAGKKWVVQPEGAEFRFRVNADNSLEDTPYARHDCGNPVDGISYPTPTLPEEKAEAETPVSDLGPQVGDPCTSIDETSGEVFSGYVSIDSDGVAYCGGEYEVEVESPWLKPLQYVICPTAGAVVGGFRSGVPGAITGAVSGGLGTYAGRELGGRNWGWAGCATGPLGGLIKWGDGGSSLLKGKPVSPPLSGSPVSPPLSLVW